MELPVEFVAFVGVLLGLVPVVSFAAPLNALLVDAGKKAGLVPDGWAGLASATLNFLVFATVYFVGAEKVQGVVEVLYSIAPFVLGLLVSAITSGLVHKVAVSLGFGKSNKKLPFR